MKQTGEIRRYSRTGSGGGGAGGGGGGGGRSPRGVFTQRQPNMPRQGNYDDQNRDGYKRGRGRGRRPEEQV